MNYVNKFFSFKNFFIIKAVLVLIILLGGVFAITFDSSSPDINLVLWNKHRSTAANPTENRQRDLIERKRKREKKIKKAKADEKTTFENLQRNLERLIRELNVKVDEINLNYWKIKLATLKFNDKFAEFKQQIITENTLQNLPSVERSFSDLAFVEPEEGTTAQRAAFQRNKAKAKIYWISLKTKSISDINKEIAKNTNEYIAAVEDFNSKSKKYTEDLKTFYSKEYRYWTKSGINKIVAWIAEEVFDKAQPAIFLFLSALIVKKVVNYFVPIETPSKIPPSHFSNPPKRKISKDCKPKNILTKEYVAVKAKKANIDLHLQLQEQNLILKYFEAFKLSVKTLISEPSALRFIPHLNFPNFKIEKISQPNKPLRFWDNPMRYIIMAPINSIHNFLIPKHPYHRNPSTSLITDSSASSNDFYQYLPTIAIGAISIPIFIPI